MLKYIVLVLIFYFNSCAPYILHLNDSEYVRMPQLFHLDPYEPCIHADNSTGIYCTVKFNLVSDEPSELFDLIREYSEKREIHYNHSILTYGICLTKTCKKFYRLDTTADQRLILEACLNETFWEEYRLKTRVTDDYKCHKYEKEIKLDTADRVVAVIIGILLLLNFIGSLQDIYFGSESDAKGLRLLSCFSIHRHWKKLVAPADGADPRLSRLKGFYGVRALGSFVIVMSHSLMSMILAAENPKYLEEVYLSPVLGVLPNSHPLLYCFFIISSFLFAFNFQVYAETHKITWRMLPKLFVGRFLRFSPLYFLMVAVVATWMRHLGSGPLWNVTVLSEVASCRRDWLYNVFYLTNYANVECVIQSWFLSSDFQLFCIGSLVLVLTTGRVRKVILGLLFLAGILIPGISTYYLDLDAMTLLSPETLRNFFFTDPTFHASYKPAHSHLIFYVSGLVLGLLFYHWQTYGFPLRKTRTLRIVFWMSVPAAIAIFLETKFFYVEITRSSVQTRALYAAFTKPLWAINCAIFVTGMVFEFEDVYRNFLEWPGWRVPSRLSYSMFVTHTIIVRYLAGSRTTTVHISILHCVEFCTNMLCMSLLLAFFAHLLIEAPITDLLKSVMLGPDHREEIKKNDKEDNYYPKDDRSDDVQSGNVSGLRQRETKSIRGNGFS